MSAGEVTLILLVGVVGVTIISSAFLLLNEAQRKSWLPILISFATGSLLATALLVTIPDASRQIGPTKALQWVLFGILFFFLLERLVIFRHCHEHDCATHKGAGIVILSGDAIHSFFDGVIIAAAFQYSRELGTATTIAILIHEIPQEVSDIAILLESGFSRRKAFFYNFLAALPALAGGILTFYFLSELRYLTPYFMSISAASLLYVAISDLVPGLHKYTGWKAGLLHFAFVLLGVAAIYLVR
ncbi:MAG: ZIP family metal transporter [Spirochaetia bacterium]|nr:ZIP family metal transporter [Spirochaetia bacterium]